MVARPLDHGGSGFVGMDDVDLVNIGHDSIQSVKPLHEMRPSKDPFLGGRMNSFDIF